MFLRTEKLPRKNAKTIKGFKTIAILNCDNCGIEYQKKFQNALLKSKFTFCNRVCKIQAQKLNGKLEIHYRKLGKHNEWVKKSQKTNMQKYGTPYSVSSKIIRQKIIDTCLKKYGVTSVWYLIEKQNKAKLTRKLKFGKEFYSQTKEYKKLFTKEFINTINQKKFQTMKDNGSYQKSQPEEDLFKILIEKFPQTIRQFAINGWFIDFYIAEIETYVQLDGVYWHGLDRDISVIENSTANRDVSILRAYHRDIKQNEWFKSQKLKLVRITDLELKTLTHDEIFSKIQLNKH